MAATLIASTDPNALKDALQMYLELYRRYPSYGDLPSVCESLRGLKQYDGIVVSDRALVFCTLIDLLDPCSGVCFAPSTWCSTAALPKL